MWSSKSNFGILPKQALHIRRRRRCPSSPTPLNTLPLSPLQLPVILFLVLGVLVSVFPIFP